MTKQIDSSAVQARLQKLLESATDTEALEIGEGVAAKTCEVFRKCFGDQTAIIVGDKNTLRALGNEVVEQFRAAGHEQLEPFVFEEKKVGADYENVERLAASLGEHRAIPVAVGSGTINDLTKLASHQTDRRYMSVATAASMDGYTAYGASITRHGSKQTFYCPAPVALVADIGVICAAPEGMNASGYADLLAKVTSGADWILADALGVEPIHERAWSLIQTELLEWVSDPVGVREGNVDAIACLTEGLIMAGLGMQAAQSSRPASGAEHQFSHLWDMQGHVHNGVAPSHGFKVGIGMLASAALYEQLLCLGRGAWDPDAIAGRWKDCPALVRDARARHTIEDLAMMAELEVTAKYVSASEIRKRFETLRSDWPKLRERLQEQLLPAGKLREMLKAAGAPSDPSHIGITRERLRKSYDDAQTIRRRYTVLDVAFESGHLRSAADQLFSEQGFWGVPAGNTVAGR